MRIKKFEPKIRARGQKRRQKMTSVKIPGEETPLVKSKPVVVESKTEVVEPPVKKVKRKNPWIEHVKKWRKQHPDLVKKLKVTEITKEARKTYVPVKSK